MTITDIKSIVVPLVVFVSIVPCEAQERRTYSPPEFARTWSHPGAHPDHIVLNFGENPATQMAVTWRTDTTVTAGFAEISIATAAPKFWRNAESIKAITERMDASKVKTAEIISHYHSVKFENLVPDTTYAYRVGDGKKWSEWIQFKTASDKADKPFSFLYVGDAQNYILELWSRLIRQGYRTAPDASFIIHAGDLVSEAHSERQWHEWFSAGGWIHSMLPSIPVLGNHEYEPYNGLDKIQGIEHVAIQWRPQFTLPLNGPEDMLEYVYFTDYNNMRIISLNTNGDIEAQSKWLEKVLESNAKTWTVVTYHHPMYSASQGRDNTELRKYWKPLFDKYQVDLALQGHDHSYARGRVSPTGENITDGLNRLDETGTVYVVSVSGGKMYRLSDGWDDLGAKRDRAAENTQLFQVIQVDGNALSYESYTATGELYDKFKLVKNAKGKPNTFIELKDEAIPSRRHYNTISYRNAIPEAYIQDIKTQYPDHKINKINYIATPSFQGYEVNLKGESYSLILTLNKNGTIIKELKKSD